MTCLERRRGLPIGNQTSQFFGNVFLDGLDHFVKEHLRCRAYIRYVDDFVILDNDKRRLAENRAAIEEYLITQRLWLHPRQRVISRTEDGLPLLGFRVWPQRRELTPRSVRRFRRRMRRYQREYSLGQLSPADVRQRISAWIGHAEHGSGPRYRRSLMGDIVFRRSAAE